MPTGKDLITHMQNLTVLPNSLAIWGIGQMGVAIKGPHAIVYIDACLSDVVREQFGDWWARGYPPPLQPTDITNATYYLTSHEHLDHLDPLTTGPAAKASPNAKFVVTGWSRDIMADLDIADERIIVPPALETMMLPGTSIRLTAVPAAHYEKEHDPQKGYRWFGYLIEWNGVTFYHAGDTIIYPGYIEILKGLPRIDVAMLPINGRDWIRETVVGATGNLLPAEAAYLSNEIGWDVLIVGHNDLYPNNAIPFGQIADALAKTAPRQKYKVLQPGELYYYIRG
jgi:L-ascorbate metabolism protein UlaG (beta-lactamase superfamily)